MNNVPTISPKNIKLDDFEAVFSSHLATISRDKSGKTIICAVHAAYLPATDFINILCIVSEIARQAGTEKFIFDNRSLRALRHQCINWYFRVWQTEMQSTGLKNFNFILPEEEWLRNSVCDESKVAINDSFIHTHFYQELGEALQSTAS